MIRYLDYFDTFGENFDFDTFKNDTFKYDTFESVGVDAHSQRPQMNFSRQSFSV